MVITQEQADAIASQLDNGGNDFFAADRAGKVLIVKSYFDRQIGSEAQARIKSVPGMPMIGGAILETMSDAVLDTLAGFIVDKFFPAVAE